MQVNSKKELKIEKIRQALKNNLKKRKLFQNKIISQNRKVKK